jgi:hypothetical protein
MPRHVRTGEAGFGEGGLIVFLICTLKKILLENEGVPGTERHLACFFLICMLKRILLENEGMPCTERHLACFFLICMLKRILLEKMQADKEEFLVKILEAMHEVRGEEEAGEG